MLNGQVVVDSTRPDRFPASNTFPTRNQLKKPRAYTLKHILHNSLVAREMVHAVAFISTDPLDFFHVVLLGFAQRTRSAKRPKP